jgi:transcriptional regulator with XRE-family HTH domain
VSNHTTERGKNLIGPAVRKLRFERKLSQAQLAARCQLHGWNASRDIIAAIEGQIRYVTDMEILRLAKALKVPFPALFPQAHSSSRLEKSS